MSVEDAVPRAPSSPQGKIAVGPRRSAAWHRISIEQGYLRTELVHRQTVEETRRFLEAVLVEALKHSLPQILICVRDSTPIFTVERYGFTHYLELAFKSRYKIALVGYSLELRIAHQYIATLARMRGVKLRAFPEESAAIAWLTSGDVSPQSTQRT